jgi:hypothetical protein
MRTRASVPARHGLGGLQQGAPGAATGCPKTKATVKRHRPHPRRKTQPTAGRALLASPAGVADRASKPRPGHQDRRLHRARSGDGTRDDRPPRVPGRAPCRSHQGWARAARRFSGFRTGSQACRARACPPPGQGPGPPALQSRRWPRRRCPADAEAPRRRGAAIGPGAPPKRSEALRHHPVQGEVQAATPGSAVGGVKGCHGDHQPRPTVSRYTRSSAWPEGLWRGTAAGAGVLAVGVLQAGPRPPDAVGNSGYRVVDHEPRAAAPGVVNMAIQGFVKAQELMRSRPRVQWSGPCRPRNQGSGGWGKGLVGPAGEALPPQPLSPKQRRASSGRPALGRSWSWRRAAKETRGAGPARATGEQRPLAWASTLSRA